MIYKNYKLISKKILTQYVSQKFDSFVATLVRFDEGLEIPYFPYLKGTLMLPICSCSYKNNILKTSHS